MAKNVSEYTRLRDIAVKRAARLVEAGLAAPMRFPTIKEVGKGTERYEKELGKLREYVGHQATVRNVKKSGTPFFNPVFGMPDFNEKKKQARKPLTEAQRARKNARARERYKEQKVMNLGGPEKGVRYRSFLRALNKVRSQWEKIGYNPGFDLEKLTLNPEQAKAFVEYLDYRFSQGDFTQKYVIDQFIMDFGKMLNKNGKPGAIKDDFELFMKDRQGLQDRAGSMSGMSEDETLSLWNAFVNR